MNSIKDMVKDSKKVVFTRFKEGELWYRTEYGFEFPVPVEDTGTATFLPEDKAMLFMRYIRKHIAFLEKAKVEHGVKSMLPGSSSVMTQKKGRYKHYQGGQYDYLGPVIQESDGTALALYRSVDTGTLFVRPEAEFFGNVVVDGKEIRRFLEDALPQPEPVHERLMDMIQELVQQSCGNDSAAITVYAEAMRLLAAEGRCRIVSEGGRRVIVEWLP